MTASPVSACHTAADRCPALKLGIQERRRVFVEHDVRGPAAGVGGSIPSVSGLFIDPSFADR